MAGKADFVPESTWRHFWHPVCSLKELRENADGRGRRKRVRLLGENLVVAEGESGVIALADKCAHRSSSLSLGWVEGNCIRCPYHGWLYDREGRCVEIPSAPEMAIPANARVARYDAQVAYDLVWLRLDSSLGLPLPPCPDWDDPAMKCVAFEPYTWKTSAARRLENFVDLAHFPFVHDGSLGSREHTVFPVPEIEQTAGEMCFTYLPMKNARKTDAGREVVRSDYRIIMPFGVHVMIHANDGSRIGLWMFASPMDSGNCRNFQMAERSDFSDPDSNHLNFQWGIVEEDVQVIESQQPPEIPHPREEISIPTDKVSMVYRRWLHELSRAAGKGPAALARCLAHEPAARREPAAAERA